jgi:hypothetical protein
MDPEKLSVACFSILALIYPLDIEMKVFTAISPLTMGLTGSPTPYLVGTTHEDMGRILKEGYISKSDMKERVVANFDYGLVKMPEMNMDDKLESLFSVIKQRIEGELKIYKAVEIFPAYAIQKHLWCWIAGLLLLSTNLKVEDVNSPDFLKKFTNDIRSAEVTKKFKSNSARRHIREGMTLEQAATRIEKGQGSYLDVLVELILQLKQVNVRLLEDALEHLIHMLV